VVDRCIERIDRMPPRPVRVLGLEGLDRELRVVAGHEVRQKRLCCGHILNAGETHLLDQAVLQRLVRPLDAALGLRRRRTDLRQCRAAPSPG
jgi:hypothetical protein